MKTAAMTVLVLAALAGPAQGADTPLWRKVGDWQVRVDDTIGGNGCFLYSITERTFTGVRIGLLPTLGAAYFMLLNEEWRSLDPSRKYSISVSFDGATPWTADAKASHLGTIPALYIKVPSEFIVQFMYRRAMVVRYDGRIVLNMNLRGTRAAGAELIKCQEAMNDSGVTRASDPFAGTGRDPFAR